MFGRKRSAVFAAEGYHPVKVATSKRAKLAGEHIALGNTGAGCAIDNVDADEAASLQTRGLVSVAVRDGEGDDRIRVGDYLYAVRAAADPDSITIQRGPMLAGDGDDGEPADATNQARPWGIVLQREPRHRDSMCTVRAFKYPGPFVIQTF